jgi:hypothetical protein
MNCKCGLPMVPVRFRKDPDRTVYQTYQCSCGQKARVGDEVHWLKAGETGRPRKVALAA